MTAQLDIAAGLSHYGRMRDELRSVRAGEPEWLAEFRDRALARFDNLGFPAPADEEWRFTPIGPIAETPFALPPGLGAGCARRIGDAEAARIAALAYPDAQHARLVFVDGVYSQELSSANGLPREVEVGSLAQAIVRSPSLVRPWLGAIASGGPSFTSLNGALMVDGAFVYVPAGVVVATPIHLVFVTTGDADPAIVSPRALAMVGESGAVTIIESYHSLGRSAGLTNAVMEVDVGPSASLDHCRLQLEGAEAYHVGRTAIRLGRDSRYTSHSVATGASVSRHDLGAVMGGENAECTMNGLYIGGDRQLLDSHTVIDHAVPNCESHELYKGILNGRAHGVFNGKVYVRPDAQKTNAKQTNQVLLLSDTARIDTKPQLEIFADDVRCTHGATIGQLDADSLFYLRSRGIALEDARNVLIHAFASDIISRIGLPEVRAHLEDILLASLPKPSSVFWGTPE
ncbi:MAG: Fe-S cluster assembly protein SufD [Armatimonadetes bacterium]|nr:Fe-S cluster assembly protein SufD [Armatimonadota bacterium]